MDNVTHTLTGLLLSRAGINRASPRATLLLVLASNVPDADWIVTPFLGSLGYLEYHRHLTHALVFAPVMGLLVALATCRAREWRFGPAWLVATFGVMVHIVMDTMNSYGLRPWLPFRGDWVNWDLLMIVEPWLLGVLFLSAIAPLFSRLVAGEIGARVASPGRGWAIFGLTFFLLWTGGRYLMHERALETLRSRNYRGQPAIRVAAWPTPWNPMAWTGYVSTDPFWGVFPVNLSKDFDPEAGAIYYKPEGAELINAARRTPEAQAFLRFSQYPVWRMLPVSEPEGGTLVEATDVRFGLPEDGKFQLRILLDPALKPISAVFQIGSPLKGFGAIRE